MEHGEVIHASGWGKIKTAAQIAMVLVLILVEGSPLWVDALVYATVLITVASAADYFFGFRKLFHARPSSHSRVET
jgi:CDP-diacylglycerol--glycerol-3-phosphate 3-phosphatidyltransferase